MAARHVERLEVVEVGLDLRAFGHLEAEADEHIFEPLPGLGDQVRVAACGAAEDLGEVEPLHFELVGAGRPRQLGAPLLERSGDHGGGRIQRLAGLLLVVDSGERTERRLEPGEHAALRQQFAVERHDVVECCGRRDALERFVACSGDCVQHGIGLS